MDKNTRRMLFLYALALVACLMAGCTVDSAMLLMLQGNVHREGGNLERAIQEYDAAIETNPDLAYAYSNRGVAYGRLGDFERALSDFDKAIELNPDANAYYYRAVTYYFLDDPAAAVADLNQAVALVPDWVDALLMRAELRGLLDQQTEAIADLTRVIELVSDWKEPEATLLLHAHAGRAHAYEQLKQPEAALADLEQMVALNPWNFHAFAFLHKHSQAVEAYRRALAEYEQTKSSTPTAAEIAFEQGRLHLLRGLYLEYPDELLVAVDKFSEAIEADPALATAYQQRALAQYSLASDLDMHVLEMTMQGDSGTVTRQNPETGEVFTQTLQAYYEESDALQAQALAAAQRADADLNQALALDPELAAAYHDLAIVRAAASSLGTVQEPDTLLALLDQAVQLEPDWPLAYRSRAFANLFWAMDAASGTMTTVNAPVEDVTYSPTGDRIATAHADGMIRIWDVQGGTQLLAWQGHEQVDFQGATSVHFSPDGVRLATTGYDNNVRIWDAETGEEVLAIGAAVEAAIYSPDGVWIASGGLENDTVRIWDAQSGLELKTLAGRPPFTFDADGTRLAARSLNAAAAIWDLQTGEQLVVAVGALDALDAVSFSPDGDYLAGVSATGEIAIWNAQTGKQVRAWNESYDGWTDRTLAYSPDGKTLITAGGNPDVRVWDAQTGEQRMLLQGHGRTVSGVAYSPDGRRIASADRSGTILLWDAQSGQVVDRMTVPVEQDEANAAVLRALEIAREDADYLIAHGATDGWPYFIRVVTAVARAELVGDEPDAAQIDADSIEFYMRSPNVNRDFVFAQARAQYQMSEPGYQLRSFLSGWLEREEGSLIYVNDEWGFRLAMPNQAPARTLADVEVPGALYVRMDDEFRHLHLVVIDANLEGQEIEAWFAAAFLPHFPDAVPEPEPLETEYGPALLVHLGTTNTTTLAFVPVGRRIYTFAYQPGPHASSVFASGYGVTTAPATTVLSELISGLTFPE